jgi:hypothetical protein
LRAASRTHSAAMPGAIRMTTAAGEPPAALKARVILRDILGPITMTPG